LRGVPQSSLIEAAGREEDKKHMEGKTTLDSAKGKAVIDNLLQTLPPEEAAKLKAALNDPKHAGHVHIDENQNVFIGDAADKAVEMRKGKAGVKKITPIDMKRIKALQERVRRWMNANPGKTETEAMQAIQQEDYDRMPVEKKLLRLENIIRGFMGQVGEDIMTLQQNQYSVSDAFDINYRAVAKMLVKLGLPVEEHAKFMKEAQDEVVAERKAAIEKHIEEEKKKMEAQAAVIEKAKMEAEAKESGKPSTESKGAELPKDATIFGGS
jgi:hypothetical protein